MALFDGAVVTLRGFGPLRVGAAVEELRTELGIVLSEGECPPIFGISGGPSNVSVTLSEDRITRISIHEITTNTGDPINTNPLHGVETLSGIGFGATEQDVIATYGTQVVIETIPAEEPPSVT